MRVLCVPPGREMRVLCVPPSVLCVPPSVWLSQKKGPSDTSGDAVIPTGEGGVDDLGARHRHERDSRVLARSPTHVNARCLVLA
jgi:hypothetical protein